MRGCYHLQEYLFRCTKYQPETLEQGLDTLNVCGRMVDAVRIIASTASSDSSLPEFNIRLDKKQGAQRIMSQHLNIQIVSQTVPLRWKMASWIRCDRSRKEAQAGCIFCHPSEAHTHTQFYQFFCRMATCHNMSTNTDGTQANTRKHIGHHTAGGNHPVACSFEDIPRYSNALLELQGIRPRVAQRRIAWQRASIKTSKHRQGWTKCEHINIWIVCI